MLLTSIARMLGCVPGSFRIARVLGIDIRVHISWLLIFFLITVQYSQLFGQDYPSWSDPKVLIVASITALLFFLSVVLHEFAHALVARRFNMSVSSITLFLLGGVASLTKEPPSARAEFFMAAAGPLTSLVIGGLGVLLNARLEGAPRDTPQQVIRAVSGTLGSINILVLGFNLIPGFPLDGGRVLRSIIWAIRRQRAAATRIAARGGQLVALAFVGLGIWLFAQGESIGLWYGLIAYFLWTAASQSIEQERIVQAVGTTRVAQLMTTELRTVPAGISLASLVREHLLAHNVRAVPVVGGDRLVGVVTIGDLRKVEQEQWPDTVVEQIMTPASVLPAVAPNDDLVSALERFDAETTLIPVTQDGRLVGLLDRESVVGYIRMREMLGFDASRQRP